MARLQLLWVVAIVLLIVGCEKRSNKPDPTKGVVSGVVICADTAKPARFRDGEPDTDPQDAYGTER